MISGYFIDRPIFASVISAFIVIAGLAALRVLPVAQYPDILPPEVEVTHINLNDKTVEGMRHREHPVFSVQYHPEAAPGPNDAAYFFEEFADLISKSKES